ncbi:MAG: D-alanyl-D-alanine carboxypeptidase [Clostridia bacterium]|nr:D-alanyl-D-alanine carboxypeptidase [Clostridia bacterium]
MKKTVILLFLCATLVVFALPCVAFAETPLACQSKCALLLAEDGTIIYEKNAHDKRPIASMTKIMTLCCIYDAIESQKLSLSDQVTVSSNASSMGGSQVFLDANTTHKVEDLIKSIIICSANDSCVAMAEHLCGSVEVFVSQMNQKAKQLGMTNTHFSNCTGLPAVDAYSTAYDVALMTKELSRHKHYFECAKIWMEDYVHPSGRITGMTNTNKLVRFYNGCLGGKTGYTCEAQHCLSAIAKRGDTLFYSVVMASPDSKTRFSEVSNMFNFGFANYESKMFVDVGEVVQHETLSNGKTALEIGVEKPLFAFGKRGSLDCRVEYELDENLKAPILQGQKVGVARLITQDKILEVNLIAKCNVDAKGILDYVLDFVDNW